MFFQFVYRKARQAAMRTHVLSMDVPTADLSSLPSDLLDDCELDGVFRLLL